MKLEQKSDEIQRVITVAGLIDQLAEELSMDSRLITEALHKIALAQEEAEGTQ